MPPTSPGAPGARLLPPLLALAGAGGLGVAALSSLLPGPVTAQPPAPAAFCALYPEAPACAAGEVDCAFCHDGPPALNAYGAQVAAHLLPGAERPLHADAFASGLGDALVQIEGLDADDDGYVNVEEIEEGTSPADAGSRPDAAGCDDRVDDGYELCGYDVAYAHKKVMIDFCGRSPTLIEKQEFSRPGDRMDRLHEVLDLCLQSEHWRGVGGRVWQLANAKVNPIAAVKAGRGAGPIPLADYDDDYAYFVWTQTGGRDVRLVLTGQTFVEATYEDGRTVYTEWDRSPDEDEAARGEDRYQAVARERRAGMLTHRWFLMSHTMFTGVPRTTAAQAYRAYLGYDIARLEGLHPVADEPVDYDNKGVAADGCEACHSTLDPLTYPFSRYEGIGGGSGRYESYSYNTSRMEGFVRVDGELVAETPEQGMLFGEPVDDLVEWAEVAANSEAFRRATVRDHWRALLREDPRPAEQAEFGALVEGLGGRHGWSVDAMLHELIETEAYGAP
jgi:hypothetical protein